MVALAVGAYCLGAWGGATFVGVVAATNFTGLLIGAIF